MQDTMGDTQGEKASQSRPSRKPVGGVNKRIRPSDLEESDEASSWEPSSSDDEDYSDGNSTTNHRNEITSHSSPSLETPYASAPAQETREDDVSDDELEVLLVIQPPTPKRPKTNVARNLPPPANQTTQQPAVESEANSIAVTPSMQFIDTQTSLANAHVSAEGETEPDEAAVAPMTTRRPKYSYRSSAYVQNLAEICYTVLWDRRWRVGESASRLFSWERGDDLSVVLSLSRLYQEEIPKVNRRKGQSDACLLCRGNKKEGERKPSEECERDQVDASIKEDPSNDSGSGTTANDTSVGNDDSASRTSTDEDEERALHLYCRLFYRKGPWFRLDDLYPRYYAPKGEASRTESTSVDDSSSDETGDGNDEHDPAKAASAFFLPKHSNGRSRSSSTGSKQVDDNAVNKHLEALSRLCRDIFRLLSMGLIRSFHDEEECGKTIGAVTDEGTGVVLTADERRLILSKLGGGSKKQTQQLKRSSSSLSKTGTSEESRRGQRRNASRENEVWKQMCCQQSIVGQIQGNSQSKILLPVSRHVNELLLDKLATKVVLSSSPGSSFSASVLRERVSETKTEMFRILKDLSVDGEGGTVADLTMCIRLREPPLRTLRRFTRLYLCASHGPGNMRGDGTNGWTSIREPSHLGPSHKDLPMLNFVQPPGSRAWHSIAYPALLHRFGISTCAFTEAYQSLPTDMNDHERSSAKHMEQFAGAFNSRPETDRMVRVFSSVEDFLTWELCTEIRANVDYLIEVNDLIHYYERRKAREASTSSTEDNEASSNASTSALLEVTQSNQEPVSPSKTVPLDFLGILTGCGRAKMLQELLSFGNDSGVNEPFSAEVVNQVQKEVETAVLALSNEAPESPTNSGVISSGLNVVQATETRPQTSVQSSMTMGRFENDCEMLIGVISIIATHVLLARHRFVSQDEVSIKASRPWLRHMWWDGNLVYVLWDCIPILEKRGYYDLASRALEVLLFGCFRGQNVISLHSLPCSAPSLLSSIMISRRARGKAYERLMIDYTHMLRIRQKEIATSEQATAKMVPNSTKRHGKKKKDRKKDAEQRVSPQHSIARLCAEALKTVVSTGSIPFSAVRSLARRVKRPLVEVLSATRSMEAFELGLRLDVTEEENASEASNAKKQTAPSYRDWTPVIDNAVANAIEGETSEVGGRCSFVGFEDDGIEGIAPTSLNVEELAMEFYSSGRLPFVDQADVNGPRGGWEGWHDEGGHVRALFRILCASVLLDVDGGCDIHGRGAIEDVENLTIFLTPYQTAPFDLHVGHAMSFKGAEAGEAREPYTDNTVVRGFYQRRRGTIDRFLSKLETLDEQELCDLVFECIVDRLRALGPKGGRDTFLQKDLQQIRTLSMLAAGFGGRLLAAMFRCLVFDYRHYSGGLPDLLLVRAVYEQTKGDDGTVVKKSLVDLGSWIGEGFSVESKQEQENSRRANLLVDRDDEFLGCSKMGDSGGQSPGRWRGGGQQRASRRKEGDQEDSNQFSIRNLPQKLCLAHNEQKVQVECMFVEVKSSNDRLDPRQEDWLNVLDRVGNARVCKFGNGKKKTGRSVGRAKKS